MTELTPRGESTWNGSDFVPPRKEDVVFGETLSRDLKLASEQFDLLGSSEMLRKLAGAYGLKDEDAVTDKDLDDLVSLAKGLDSETGEGMESQVSLIENGADPELLNLLYEKSRVARAGRGMVLSEISNKEGDEILDAEVVEEGAESTGGTSTDTDADDTEAVDGEIRDLDAITNDLILISQKVTDANRDEVREAYTRLDDDGINVNAFLREGLNLRVNEEDRKELGRRRSRLRRMAQNIQGGKVDVNDRQIAEKIGLDLDDLPAENEEGLRVSLDEYIRTNELIANQILLNTDRQNNTGVEDVEEREFCIEILRHTGVGDEELTELERNVVNAMRIGDRSLQNNLFERARLVYLESILGDNLRAFLRQSREIQSLMGESIPVTKELGILLKGIVRGVNEVAEERGWEDEEQKRLLETLKSLFMGEDRMKEAKRDRFSREIKVEDVEDKMMLRGAVIEVVGNAHSNDSADGLYDRVKNTFLARKGVSMGVLPAEIEAVVKTELRARLELHQSSLFWNRMKDDKNPEADTYASMKSGLSNMPILSEETYRWLMEDNRDSSYIYLDPRSGERKVVECENLRREMDVALKKIFDYITSTEYKYQGVEAGDLWVIMNYDQQADFFRKLGITDENVGKLAFQLAEAECWTAMRPGSYHPARRLAYLADYRMERLSKGLSVPGGLRLLQEYRDAHDGAMPFEKIKINREGETGGKDVTQVYEVGLFDAEGVSLARLGLDMHPDLRNNAGRGTYLESLSAIYNDPESKIRSAQFDMRADLSYSATVFDAFEALGKPPVGFDALAKLRGVLYPWYVTRFGGGNLHQGVAELTLEYAKTFLWANSVANNIKNTDASKISDLRKYTEETYMPLVDAADPNSGKGALLAGNDMSDKRLVENRSSLVLGLPVGQRSELIAGAGEALSIKGQIEDLNEWFTTLIFDKCYPILESARADSSLTGVFQRWTGSEKLPLHLMRSDRNQPTLKKLQIESAGFKENIRGKLKRLVSDKSKWWNRL